MNNNRDYWAKPIQSDRNAHDYGHTHLSTETEGDYKAVILGLVTGLTVILLAWWLS